MNRCKLFQCPHPKEFSKHHFRKNPTHFPTGKCTIESKVPKPDIQQVNNVLVILKNEGNENGWMKLIQHCSAETISSIHFFNLEN